MNPEKQSEIDLIIAKKLVNLHTSATSRGIDFTMSFEGMKKIMYEKNCFFTGKPLNNKQNDPLSKTVDRVDNDKGYTDENAVACSLEFNRIKKDLTIDQVRLMVEGFKKMNIW